MAGMPSSAGVVFNEILFHAASHDPREDFVELLNTGPVTMDLKGWRIEGGIGLVFTNALPVPAGGLVVVAADGARYREVHPDAPSPAGVFTGALSNKGETLELHDATGAVVNRVVFGQDGEWSTRVRSAVDRGHRGWEWSSAADGEGRSLELIQSALENGSGQNWSASAATNGSPGRANGVASMDVAPLILDVRQYPGLPMSKDAVWVRARLVDEGTNGVTARLHHRVTTEAGYESVPMWDDGGHGDGQAGDGVYGATLPARAAGSVVEFYVSAGDAGGRTRIWPAPGLEDGVAVASLNALYLVDDEGYAGSQPMYRIVLRPEDRAELLQINRNTPAAPYPGTGDQTFSHARFNATFVGTEGGVETVRYGVLVKNRGNGSRFKSPQSFRVDFASVERWNGVTAINLNTQYPDSQLLGSALFRRIGLGVAESRPVQLRVNGVNHALPGAPTYGFVVANEVIDVEFAKRQFPRDAGGNLYRAQRLDGVSHAALDDRGPDPGNYRNNYFKRSNRSEDDWTDLIELSRVASLKDLAEWRRELPRVADVGQWARYFAANAMVDNRETSPVNGDGDDYFLYRGGVDRRFQLLPYDLDTILNVGDSPAQPRASFFQLVGQDVPNFERYLTDPEFVPAYFAELRRLARAVFAADRIGPLVDHVLAGLSTPARIQTMKDFAAQRAAFALSEIPERLSVASDLPTNGVPTTTSATLEMRGRADPVGTRRVLVNGAEAEWVAWRTRWTNAAVALRSGMNRVLVQAMDGEGREIEHVHFDVIRTTTAAPTPVGGTLSGTVRWTAVGSPYLLTGGALIPVGSTLVIEPGVTVYCAANAGLGIEGRLLAEGTAEARIRFRRPPGTVDPTNSWQGLTFSGATATNRLAYVDLEHAGSARHSVSASGSTVILEDCTFSGTRATLIETLNSSWHIRRCDFPSLVGAELIHGGDIPAGGFLIIEECRFGTTTGLNDIIDFSRARRPGPILQVWNNVFTGASDDVLDLDGCDAHIEGNVFLDVTNGDPGAADTSSAISFGEDGGYGPRVVAARNFFHHVDHVALCKEGGFLTLENNTAVKVGIAVVNFSEPLRGVRPGAGARLRGNLFVGSPVTFENARPTNGTVAIDAAYNALSGADAAGFETRNEPWTDFPVARPTVEAMSRLSAREILAELALSEGSPAVRRGPDGSDLGASVAPGAWLGGLPSARTWRRDFALSVGGPGIVNYRSRVDGGAWSEPVPVETAWVLASLGAGLHRVEVVGQNSAGVWQSESEASRGEWTVDLGSAGVVINKVLAGNGAVELGDSGTPDLVELLNDGPVARDLAGGSLSNDASKPKLFVFPEGTVLAPGARLVLAADVAGAPGVPALGFRLSADGDSLHLFGADGREVDVVRFGAQVEDVALGRIPDGTGAWTLVRPVFGVENRAVPYVDGGAGAVRINEWLASPRWLASADFVELHNAANWPARLDGMGLTDNAVGDPAKAVFRAASFLGARMVRAWKADDSDAPGHARLRLAAESGSLALVRADGTVVDDVFYGNQSADVSEGRGPDGSESFRFFVEPTPGAPNGGGGTDVQVVLERTPLLGWTQVWKYRDDGVDLGTGWREPGYADASWPSGPGLLYHETAALPGPKSTPLKIGALTHYFRTHFRHDGGVASGEALSLSRIVDDGAIFWLNGRELARDDMAAGTAGYATEATRTVGDGVVKGPVALSAEGLLDGDNVLAVEVHQSDAASSDVVLGVMLELVRQFTNSSGQTMPVLLNEVLARSEETVFLPEGAVDWVELYNPSTNVVDLAGCSVTDEVSTPRKYVIPAGRVLEPKSAWVLTGSGAGGTGGVLGFGLAAEGGVVFLFDAPSRGGGLLDVVRYGNQLADRSLGRVPDGGARWALNVPTPGVVNRAAAVGSPADLRINEWLADPLAGDDWLELFNTGSWPVDLGGCSLTDDETVPRMSVLPSASFVGTGSEAFLVFAADGNADRAGHVAFKLAKAGETLRLFGPGAGLPELDRVRFGAQQKGTSEGRFPDGSTVLAVFPNSPSPGASNRLAVANPDSDGDRLPDAWELANGLRSDDATGDNGAAGDPDGDGATNLEEWKVGTHPREAGSAFRVEVGTTAAGQVQIGFRRPAGRTAELQVWLGAWEQAGRTWEPLKIWAAGPAEEQVVYPLGVGAGLGSVGFYRVVIRE